MFDNALAQQALQLAQLTLPVVLFALLLSAFVPASRAGAAQAARDGDEDLPGVVPVILAVNRPRTTLLVALLALLSSTYLISLVLLLVLQRGHPPAIAVWAAASGLVTWATTTALLYETRARAPPKGALWAKTMLWIGLIGESMMGSLRVYIFVQSTSHLPQTAFPLPFFLHFALLSVRLLHFVLALWAISSPRREFVPAVGRRSPEAAGDQQDAEREGLLAGVEESNLGGGSDETEASGYGTFAGKQDAQEASSIHTQPRAASVKSKASSKAPSQASIKTTGTAPADEGGLGPEEATPRPTSYADAVKAALPGIPSEEPAAVIAEDEAPAEPEALEIPISATSNILDLTISSTDNRTTASSKASTPPTPGSPVHTSIPLPLTTSTMPTPAESPAQQGLELDAVVTPAEPQPPSTIPFPSSLSSRASTEVAQPESATPESAEKRKRMTSLADMGRKMSDESKALGRKLSLLKRGKSNSGTSSPANDSATSPVDGTTSPKPDSFSSPTLQKRFSLLSRKSSTPSTPSSPTPEQQPLAGSVDAPPASAPSASHGGGGGGKKGKGGQKGRNGKGKKVSKFPNQGGKRSPH